VDGKNQDSAFYQYSILHTKSTAGGWLKFTTRPVGMTRGAHVDNYKNGNFEIFFHFPLLFILQ
jgi:hypothetical protein